MNIVKSILPQIMGFWYVLLMPAIKAQASLHKLHAQIQRVEQGVWTPTPCKITKAGFLSNTGPDSLKNHKATKPAFNGGPSSARQQTSLKWLFTGGLRWLAFSGILIPLQLKKQQKMYVSKVGPPLKKLLDPRMNWLHCSHTQTGDIHEAET